MPSPTQGPAVLNALRRLDELPPLGGTHPDWSPVVEAIIEGMAEAGFDLRKIGVAAAGQAMRSAPAPAAEVRAAGRGDTSYIAAFDENGNSASLITSVFGDFGSYFGVPELGGPLLNRAAMLRVLAEPPRPGEKPPHTTIPASVTRDGSPAFALGVAGGFMQAQAQVQILVHLLDRGLAPQQAVDEPRLRVTFGGDLALEPGHPLGESHPEALDRPTDREGFGCAQIAGLFGERLTGAADGRRGGAVASSV
jgi:gamma-glutamyltranspeptidase/glutathione hydrolase